MNQPKILLADLSSLVSTSNSAICYSAPLGLYSLAALQPELIHVLDTSANLLELALTTANETTTHLICMVPEPINTDTLTEYFATFRQHFPKIQIGVNREISTNAQYINFVEKGNGRASIYRILDGHDLPTVNTPTTDELDNFLPIPTTPFIDKGYSISPEKTLCNKTLEVYQPWRGLQERCSDLTYPDAAWFAGLGSYIQNSNYNGVHFRPMALNPERIAEILAALNLTNTKFALSVPESLTLPEIVWTSKILKQIWYYNPNDFSQLSTQLKQFKSKKIKPCLEICPNITRKNLLTTVEKVERLTLENEENWSPQERKEILQRFWFSNFRFIKRLGTLKNAAELIAYIKSLYQALDTILERKAKI